MTALKHKSCKTDAGLGLIFFLTALFCVLLLASLLLFLLLESWPVWTKVGVWKFISGQTWLPLSVSPQVGVAPMLVSTIWVSGGALLLAAPLGFACAVFMVEFAPRLLAAVIRPVLNLLTGIPSVVYGFLGASILVNFFEVSFDLPSGESLFAASVVLAIMVLPFITANSEAALRSIPAEYRHTSLALGVSRPYYVVKVLCPAARRGMMLRWYWPLDGQPEKLWRF
ncbi:PstC family ABC transporter permease [Syntrophomonas palmitatica]|uniref:PstC family ABC transporter permease n=1 Tax=Syntrophomonas palmitatica TaxID=402877 RepID=UPI0006D0AD44|nr:ABC transporter permease subunit [Syntrophomonas palmitatica]